MAKESDPATFLNLLIERKQYADAVRVLAHLLPEREAVWWACLCTWHAVGPRLTAREHTALGAAVYWVHDPSTANQKRAAAGAEPAERRNAAARVARAASEAVYPPGSNAAAARRAAGSVATSVRWAVFRSPPDERERLYRQYLRLGNEIAAGGMRWD